MNDATVYGLYAVLASGAAGLYLALPSSRTDARRLRRVGLVLGLAAVAAAGAYLIRWIGAGFEGRAFFVFFAVLGVLAAARVVTHPKPVYSAMYFVVVVLASAGLCFLAAAEFLGVALVIIYGGAILVTYVFVIMLAQQTGQAPYDRQAREPAAAVLVGFLLVSATAQALAVRDPIVVQANERRGPYGHALDGPDMARKAADGLNPAPGGPGAAGESTAAPVGNTRSVGEVLLTTHVMALEVAGALLLVAVVGAIAIARKRIEPEALTDEERQQLAGRADLHARGREARPF